MIFCILVKGVRFVFSFFAFDRKRQKSNRRKTDFVLKKELKMIHSDEYELKDRMKKSSV